MGLINANGKIAFDVLVGSPGSGKSFELRREALNATGLYLFCLPTIPLIQEQVREFRELRPDLSIIQATSGEGGGRGKVQRQLDDARSALAAAGTTHAIIFITHESMMARDLSAFTDWHVRIDEVPNAIQTGKMTIGTKQSERFFSASFGLKSSGDWAHARLKDPAGNWRDNAADSLMAQQGEFFKYAARPQGVFVNVSTWSGTKSFEWFALWSPTFLKHVSSVKIAAAAYLDSLGAKAALNWWAEDVEINMISIPATPVPRSGHPAINIHYFTEGHEGTTKIWEQNEGRRMIKAVCDYLAANEPKLGFWSGNDEVRNLMEWRVSDDKEAMTKPKLAGSNKYRERTSCAFIYSSKPQTGDGPLQELFGITEKEILTAREDEDIHQFVMRGAIRNDDYDGAYDIYLYSRRQAEALAAKLEESKIARSIEVVPLYDAEIMDETLAKPTEEVASKPSKVATRVPGAKGGDRLLKSKARKEQRDKKMPKPPL